MSTKGKFADHVKIDDEKLRERDREAFKRNNPKAYEMIQRQKELIDQGVIK